MNTAPLNIPGLLKQFGLRPDKRLGQVFLVDSRSLRRIVKAATVSSEDIVLEIGPGLGSLTRYLADEASEVITIELDPRLIPALEKVLESYSNVRVINDDILNLDPSDLMGESDYLVVANIPYYITSQLIRHLLETKKKPRIIVLTIQHEVAQRICAAAGNTSLLTLSVQVYGKPEITSIIPAKSFYPRPKVDSAVVRIEIYPEPLIPPDKLDVFFRLAKAGFSQKRKTLRNSISAGLAIDTKTAADLLRRAEIDPQRRAETLSIQEWSALTAIFDDQYQDI